jgi:lipopolysaccharide heptosyltransferase I
MPQPGEQSFLIVRLGSMGDLIHTVPAVASLRASFPQARIDWVVEQKWAPLIGLVTAISEVIPWRRGVGNFLTGTSTLRQRGYSCAVDFQGLYKSALLARFSGAQRRIGFGPAYSREGGAAWFYTDRVNPTGKHIAELNLRLAEAAGAAKSDALVFPLELPEYSSTVKGLLEREGIQEFCVVTPGGGWRSKCWPAERYGALCEQIMRKFGVRAIVNAGPAEEELGRAVINSGGAAKPVVLSPSLHELAALLGRAKVVVGADTGPLHLAAALGAPVVALFGPTDPVRNGPIPKGIALRNAGEQDTTYNRGDSYSPSMLSLSVEQVMTAVEREWGACS